MSVRTTEHNIAEADTLVAGGMSQTDAIWFLETHNMVAHVFHGNPAFAFQDSDSGVRERYERLADEVSTILSGDVQQQVVALRVPEASTHENVMRMVEDALRKMRIGLDHYGDENRQNAVLAAEVGRIVTAFGQAGSAESTPVVNRIEELMTLDDESRALLRRALALSGTSNTSEPA